MTPTSWQSLAAAEACPACLLPVVEPREFCDWCGALLVSNATSSHVASDPAARRAERARLHELTSEPLSPAAQLQSQLLSGTTRAPLPLLAPTMPDLAQAVTNQAEQALAGLAPRPAPVLQAIDPRGGVLGNPALPATPDVPTPAAPALPSAPVAPVAPVAPAGPIAPLPVALAPAAAPGPTEAPPAPAPAPAAPTLTAPAVAPTPAALLAPVGATRTVAPIAPTTPAVLAPSPAAPPAPVPARLNLPVTPGAPVTSTPTTPLSLPTTPTTAPRAPQAPAIPATSIAMPVTPTPAVPGIPAPPTTPTPAAPGAALPRPVAPTALAHLEDGLLAPGPALTPTPVTAVNPTTGAVTPTAGVGPGAVPAHPVSAPTGPLRAALLSAYADNDPAVTPGVTTINVQDSYVTRPKPTTTGMTTPHAPDAPYSTHLWPTSTTHLANP